MAATFCRPPFAFDPLPHGPHPSKSAPSFSNLRNISSNLGKGNLSPVRSLSHSLHFLTNPAIRFGFRDMGLLGSRFEVKGFDFGRIRAVSGGGSGGDGGFGGWGDGSSGDGNGDESPGDDGSFFSWYLTALDKHPVITKSITSAILTLIGDLICQILIDHVSKLDLKRTLVFTFLGLVLVGPTLHFWYLSLSKLVSLPGTPGTILRLLLDQFIFSPIFIGIFLSSLITLEGRPSLIVPKLQQEWFSSVLANWQLWIPFQFLNFQFVPQKFQVLAANIVALAWNVILSYKAHKEVVLK